MLSPSWRAAHEHHPYPFRIMQTPGLTLIVYEGWAHVWRQIFTDGRQHSKDPNPSWWGESIGWRDGGTFVWIRWD
jgi:hypothetical protein